MTESSGSEELARLKAQLDGALAALEGVELKRLFGCDGYFTAGNIFALVWKEGRLGYRISDPEKHAELMATSGSTPWIVAGKRVRHWVLLPRDWHRQAPKLRAWGRLAHALASARPEKSRVTGTPKKAKIRPATFRWIKRGKD